MKELKSLSYGSLALDLCSWGGACRQMDRLFDLQLSELTLTFAHFGRHSPGVLPAYLYVSQPPSAFVSLLIYNTDSASLYLFQVAAKCRKK